MCLVPNIQRPNYATEAQKHRDSRLGKYRISSIEYQISKINPTLKTQNSKLIKKPEQHECFCQ